MKKMMVVLISGISLMSSLATASANSGGKSPSVTPVIPLPTSFQSVGDRYDFGESIEYPARLGELPEYGSCSNAKLFSVVSGESSEIEFIDHNKTDNPEGYQIEIDGTKIRIQTSTASGQFYALQTLCEIATRTPQGNISLPQAIITDAPRFAWRGVLLDVSRHFFGKQTVMRLLDEMARVKLNVLHLHLTDDPGWRLEIPGYPKLTEVGAQGDIESSGTGEPQFYTADDIREIVTFAAKRHIMVIPEIDMPGHSGAAAKSYPQFFDGDKTFNPASEEGYQFIRAVFTEVVRLFPAPYIHFGGDEVREAKWASMPDIDALKQRENLRSKEEVERYFGTRVTEIIHSLNKQPIAWDDQFSAGTDKGTVIQWWRKDHPEVRDAALKAGYDIIISPVDQVYFDYPQGPGEPGAPWEGNDNGPTSLAKILAWEPVPQNLSADEITHVKGVEAALWTEFIRSDEYLEYMAFPRLLAFAEVAWGQQQGPRNLEEFKVRLSPKITELRERGINARRGFNQDAVRWVTH